MSRRAEQLGSKLSTIVEHPGQPVALGEQLYDAKNHALSLTAVAFQIRIGLSFGAPPP